MCLAEALLRIPDAATRDALIADKIGGGEWRAHVGHSPSPFVNAATWGLLITGQLIGAVDETGLGGDADPPHRALRRADHPRRRRHRDARARRAIRLRPDHRGGAGQRAGRWRRAAIAIPTTCSARPPRPPRTPSAISPSYEAALDAIGAASAGRGIYEGPGLSIKLSALHPRYCARPAPAGDGRALSAAEAPGRSGARATTSASTSTPRNPSGSTFRSICWRALCRDPAMAGWNGVGFVVQAYQKRAYAALDWIVDLARATKRRIMLRLVKGAYWDSEIKRAQVDGLEGFPVFTRKIHTDVSYLACARLLLEAPDAVFPQFATHNALTLATIHAMAGKNFYAGQYEFQCLHGMGEPLYDQIVGRAPTTGRAASTRRSARTRRCSPISCAACWRTAPTPPSSIASPTPPFRSTSWSKTRSRRRARSFPSARRIPRSSLPRDLFAPERANSAGLDLSNEARLAALGPSAREKRASGLARGAPRGRGARDRQSGGSARRRRPCRRRRRGGGRRGVRARRARRGPAWSALDAERARAHPASRRRRCFERQAQELAGLICPRGGQDAAQRARRRARGGRFPALLRGADRRAISPTRRIARWESSSASARGTSRSPSSPARSPPRSPPATR